MLAIVLTLIAAYVTLVAFLFLFQRKLIYHPDTAIEPPEYYGLEGFGEHFIPSSGGARIQLWYRPAAPGFPTILYFHGNAYHMGSRAGIYAALAARGFGVLALSYRGYGKSSGRPSEQGLYHDARAAIGFLTGQMHIPLKRILFYGESLGTGVAVQMAGEYPVAGLILQAAYTSVAVRAAEIYRFIPVRLLITDRFHSLHKIRRINMPLLLFHGELDDTIPIAHGQALFNAAAAPRKHAFFFPGIGHNDFDSGVISAHVLDFAKQYQLIE